MRIRVVLVSAFITAVLPVLFAAPVLAQDYGGGTLTIADPTLGPDDPFRIAGTGCPSNARVTVALDGEPTGTTTADADGAFTSTATVPAGTAPGVHTLTATCDDLVQSVRFTVPDPATGGASPGDGALPWTGSDVGPLLRGAIALALAGTGLVLLTRRRNATRRPA